jgi:hypothetical protein
MGTAATFRCKRSGNLMTVSDDTAVAELRKHESYEEVLSTQGDPHGKSQEVQETPEKVLIKKRRGRQPVVPSFLGDIE